MASHLLWFDTEDYVEPTADDAALRLALELEKMGVRATFKVVGEKARMLESRGRRDVIRASLESTALSSRNPDVFKYGLSAPSNLRRIFRGDHGFLCVHAP